MKKLRFLAPVLFVLSCTKQSTNELISTAHPVTKPAECTIDIAAVRAAIDLRAKWPDATSIRRKPAPTPTTSPTTSGYSCIYIDFDGQTVNSPYWNNGNTLQCYPSGLTIDQMAAVVTKVTAEYSLYNVTITSNESIFLAANPAMRIRVIVTPTSAWRKGVSGITYTGSFSWGDGTPCFVFSDRLYNDPSFVGEIVSHEAGHSLGLNHQSDYDLNCNLVNAYRQGVTMGSAFNVAQGVWTYGTSTSCSTYQNDNQVLTAKLGLK